MDFDSGDWDNTVMFMVPDWDDFSFDIVLYQVESGH